MKINSLSNSKIRGTNFVYEKIKLFDFYKLRWIEGANINPRQCPESDLFTVDIIFHYETDKQECYLIMFRFLEVRQLVFPSFSPYAFVSEIELEDVSCDQLEGISFQMLDRGQSDFLVQCKSIEIISCETC